jgi:hypothetical protein
LVDVLSHQKPCRQKSADFDRRSHWVSADEKEEMAIDIVIERLRHEGEGILLIFDNAVDADALDGYHVQRTNLAWDRGAD